MSDGDGEWWWLLSEMLNHWIPCEVFPFKIESLHSVTQFKGESNFTNKKDKKIFMFNSQKSLPYCVVLPSNRLNYDEGFDGLSFSPFSSISILRLSFVS